MKHNDDVLIDRFLRGELTEEEKKNFQQKLEEEGGFSQKVREMEEISSGIRESVLQEKRELLAGFEDEILSEGEQSVESGELITGQSDLKRRINMRRLWWLATAAAVFIGVVMFWPHEEVKGPSEKYADLFGDDFETSYVLHSVKRGETGSPKSSNKERAYNLYSARMFEEAIPSLRKEWANNQDTLALYYLGISYLGVGKDEQGEEILLMEDVKNIISGSSKKY